MVIPKANSSLAIGGLLASFLFCNSPRALGDEGMWLFNHPPLEQLKIAYDFEPSSSWLEHLQKASVRFNNGGSGSFVSPDGLIITNHHVGADTLQKLSSEHRDYLRDGFFAHGREEEKRALDLELNVLMSIKDVTARVNSAITPTMNAEEAFAARRAIFAQIESESLKATGLRSDVVTLYGGAQYHLYCYKRYTDVRLVFAPERQAAAFGGDPDNFEFPRFNLDFCLFRAYENGKPAKVEHFLRWSEQGVQENELVFVSGHPGSTDRQLTVSELEDLRDRAVPRSLGQLYRGEVSTATWAARSEENGRRSQQDLHAIENRRKALDGRLAGLLDPELMAAKRQQETQFRELLASSAQGPETQSAWEEIGSAQKIIAQNAIPIELLEGERGFNSSLFGIARTLLRSAEEKLKPDGERLREYRESNRESLELSLFSQKPIYEDVETRKLTVALTWLAVELGPGNELVTKILAGKSPHDRAVELVAGTKLKEIALRKKLYADTPETIASVHDPMIELARLVDPESRRLRKILETQDEVKRQAYAKINRARFGLEKGQTYPDATFTLRLAFGAARGYSQDGASIPFQTTFAGMFERAEAHHQKPPFNLPARWQERKERLNMATPFNFVATPDIIGGNSGSPVVNRAGEFVGIIFDGNIQSLAWDYAYSDKQGRAVSVNSQAIMEALEKIYDAPELAKELRGK